MVTETPLTDEGQYHPEPPSKAEEEEEDDPQSPETPKQPGSTAQVVTPGSEFHISSTPKSAKRSSVPQVLLNMVSTAPSTSRSMRMESGPRFGWSAAPTGRVAPITKTEGPGPGAYELRNFTVSRDRGLQGSVKFGASAAATGRCELPKQAGPGPGAYNHKDMKCTKPFVMQKAPKRNFARPEPLGPGAYDIKPLIGDGSLYSPVWKRRNLDLKARNAGA